MSKSAAREQLNRKLVEHLNNIHETFQILDDSPVSALDKASWKDVVQLGEQVSKQATMVGMLYSGETPGQKVLEENMDAYVNLLQGFLLMSHGCSAGAGPTLASCIHGAIKQVVDCSFKLFQGAVSSYGSPNKDQKLSIAPLVGIVWEACSALKKTPSTNVTAIGRAMTQVAVLVKDALREMKELKPENEEAADELSEKMEDKSNLSDDDLCDEELGNDLSLNEMKIAQLTTNVVSDILVVLKEVIRSITGLLQKETSSGCAVPVDSLEKLLKLCQGVGTQVDELGACLYPPQEISAIKVALGNISSFTDEMHVEIENLKGTSEDFVKACNGLKGSVSQLESQLSCIAEVDLVQELENLLVNNKKGF